MDVHKPRAAHSWREFAVEIGTVTIGILIALTLEALVEAARTHALVEHARAEMRAELTSDREGVANTVRSAEDADKSSGVLAAMLQAKLKGEPPPSIHNLTVAMNFRNLDSGAWESTVATQALTHMPFGEARALSAAYGDVRSFNELEHDASREWFQIFSLPFEDEADPRTLHETLSKVKLGQAYVRGLDQSGAQTLASIDKALASLDGRAPPKGLGRDSQARP